MNSTALIIDIRESRKMCAPVRLQAQQRIKECMHALDPVFFPHLLYKMEFSGGDGVEGLFETAVSAYLYARLFLLFVYPVPVRCGIGHGSINVIMESDRTNAQDGTAFHRARQCLSVGRKEPDRSIVFCSGQEQDYLINALLLCANILHNRQTEVRHGYRLLLELHSPFLLDELMSERFDHASCFLMNRINDCPLAKKPPFAQEGKICKPILLNTIDKSAMTVNTAKHGIASAIAKAAGVKPQNVQNVLFRGALNRIRDMEAAVAILLKNHFDENVNRG